MTLHQCQVSFSPFALPPWENQAQRKACGWKDKADHSSLHEGKEGSPSVQLKRNDSEMFSFSH